jgi:REP element-mobilizing transposase RayT
LIKPDEITIVHAVAKTARNLFLLGEDLVTKTHNSHRKDWILDILEFQSSLMAIDLLGFSLLSNHVHQILRSRPDAVKEWTDLEVARRWMNLCPKSRKCLTVGDKVVRVPIPPKETQIQALAQNPKKIAQLREQLSSISWWMRLLCQKIAQRANLEDGGSLGHFWKGRFHATVIEDNEYMLGCSFYVDLNAFQAGLAQGIEDYDYTSAKIRLDMLRAKMKASDKQEGPPLDPIPKPPENSEHPDLPENSEKSKHKPETKEPPVLIPKTSKGEFLSKVKLDTLSNEVELHKGGFRCSDKGFLSYTDKEYLDALEWCIRNKILEREMKTLPEDTPMCIKQHRFGAEMIIKQARGFGQMYRYRTGREQKVEEQQESSPDGTSQSV